MNKIYFVLLPVFFSSCLHINYLGSSLAPTKTPDFYVDEKNINKPYKIVGKGYPNVSGALTLKNLQKKAIEKAKRKGADAVLVQDYFVPAAVASSSATFHSNNAKRGITGYATIPDGYSVDTQFIILFLKYTDQ